MIVLDASTLIAHLAGPDDALHGRAAAALAEVDLEPLLCSTITMAEVLVGPAAGGRMDVARRSLDRLGVLEVGLPADAALRLATLRAATGLKLPDCCVLLAAEEAGAKTVLTFDDRLAAAARERGL